MKWSLSSSKAFFQCPKKWYYQTIYANSRVSDLERKRAYLLKHLQSIYIWRGKLVDQVISRFIVPKLNKKEEIEIAKVLKYANNLMEAQLKFAKEKKYRNESVNSNAYDYCALKELETGGSVKEDSINQIQNELKNALTNLIGSTLIKKIKRDGQHLIAQRSLSFKFSDVTVSCTPDLVVFFKDKPPLIVDWKVESLGQREHWLQLGIYGVALSRVTPHKDFPNNLHNEIIDPTRLGLVEFQLLRNQEVRYALTYEDIIDIEDYIYMSSKRMLKMVNGSLTPEATIKTLPRARSPETCLRCNFKSICWEESCL